MSAPQVYRAITAIAAELSGVGIPKRHLNERDDYRYRSIDDVLNRLSPLLAKHKLCVLPRVLERTSTDRVGEGDLLLVGVALRVAFDLVSSADGSSHTVEAFGEALDHADKATAKAVSSAYKQAMLQTFCVPVAQIAQIEDADASSHRLKRCRTHVREPVGGWTMWTSGITDIVESCMTGEALKLLQKRQRPLLKALSRENPDLYAQIGAAFAKRTAELDGEQCTISGATADGERCANRESEAPPIERAQSQGTRRSRNRPTSTEPADGEACANRRRRRQAAPTRHKSKRTTDARLQFPNRLERQKTREPNGRECPAHRAWVRRHHCCVPGCLGRPIECAHVRGGTDGGIALKPSDRWSVSLCRNHHIEQHQVGELSFGQKYGIDLRELAKLFARRSPHHRKLRSAEPNQ